LIKKVSTKKRCEWCGKEEIYINYHDTVWAVPVKDDRTLFEFLTLEGAQAGLSWITILKRREGYLDAFDNFDVEKVAAYGKRKINSLLKNTGIIRNQLKINSTISNAQAFIKIQEEFGSFAKYQWQIVGNKPVQNKWKSLKEIPGETDISKAWSKDLKKRGFRFVGPTIVYAHMQAVGMVNDHIIKCFRYKETKKLADKFKV